MSSEITPTTVDVDTVRSKINDDSLRLIDVRREEDYNQGHGRSIENQNPNVADDSIRNEDVSPRPD